MIAAFAVLMTPAADPEVILGAVLDRYSRVEAVSGVAVHRGGTGLDLPGAEVAEGERTYIFTWKGPKDFEVKRGTGGDPFAPFYRGDGRDVYAIYPDQRRIKVNSTPREGVVHRWEAQAGLLFSLVAEAPVLKQLTETPPNYDRSIAWGERKQLLGQSIREMVISTNPRKMDVGGEEGQEEPPPPYRITLYLHDYRPDLIGYSYSGDPDVSLVYYRDVKLKP